MNSSEAESWYAVRCVFAFTGWGDDGATTYEERVTLWQAPSAAEALDRAAADALEYAATLEEGPHALLDLMQCYELRDNPGDGAEVFSLMRDSPLSPTDYISTFFDTGTERQRHV